MWSKRFSCLSVEGSLPLEIPERAEKSWLMQIDNDYHGRNEKNRKGLMFL